MTLGKHRLCEQSRTLQTDIITALNHKSKVKRSPRNVDETLLDVETDIERLAATLDEVTDYGGAEDDGPRTLRYRAECVQDLLMNLIGGSPG